MRALTKDQRARAVKEAAELVRVLRLVMFDYMERGNLDRNAAKEVAKVMARVEGRSS